MATSGRRHRTYVGTIRGRRMPFGARPIEQIYAFVAGLVATCVTALALPYPTPAVFAVGTAIAFAAALAVAAIPYDGIPIVGKSVRVAGLLLDRKPTVVAVEEANRQVAANPHAFVVDDATDSACESE